MKISCVINLDSRPEKDQQTGLFGGVVSKDLLLETVRNKLHFLKDFTNKEIIVFIDRHNPIDQYTLDWLHYNADIVCVRKHTTEHSFNDWNYQRALRLATGDIIMHFDMDVCAFVSSDEPLKEMINLLEQYSFISYPSPNSPYAAHDNSFDYSWASTRFFMCKREILDLTELDKMQRDYEYCYSTYPASRREHWTEHLCGLLAKYKGKGVYYPPIDTSKLAIFTWENYKSGTLKSLNDLPYEEVANYIQQAGGIFYPNNLNCI